MFGRFLSGRTALVTGSSSGIGKAIATCLARSGASVAITGLEPRAEIEPMCKSIESEFQVNSKYYQLDVSDPNAIRTMMGAVSSELGAVDVLVNNAGFQHVCPVVEFPDEIFEKMIKVNLNACFHTSKAALPHMLKQNWGRIINISSVHGKVASSNKIAYVASKHGVIGLTKVLALEHATTGVTANVICPGWVETPLVQKQIEALAQQRGVSVKEASEQLLGEKQPSKQFSTPEDIGNQVLWLCTDAAHNVRGAELVIDGAWTIQ